MKTFRNKNFETRNYECTNIAACQAEVCPGDNWEECDESFIGKMTMLWIETVNGVRMSLYGWL